MAASLHVILPAAGVGRRMAGEQPKQYLPLLGRPVIEWSLEPFFRRHDVARIVVVLPANDVTFDSLSSARDPRIHIVTGGSDRAASVQAGLSRLDAHDTDWVLVHDAARPCLHAADLEKLIAEIADHEVGGLLAAPVAETLKSADASNQVAATLPRENVWRAMTPQMFRFGLLRRALNDSLSNITDESMAIERFGLKPRLIAGRADNIKITVPEDLAFAEFVLRQRSVK
jgi:2-C-methyl-D-erythritol 4-phosphate cytidylyltransferase